MFLPGTDHSPCQLRSHQPKHKLADRPGGKPASAQPSRIAYSARVHSRSIAAVAVALLSLTAACSSNAHPALAKPSPTNTFAASGVSDYLKETHQWDLPNQQAIADGESLCTKLRQGASVPQGMKQMQADWGNAKNSEFVAHIAEGAEQHLCPDQHDTFDAWYSAFLKAPATPSAAASSASKTAISTYLSMFRGMGLPQFSPQKISDAKLIAVGREACSDLETHKPAQVLTMLEHEGWSRGDGSDVLIYASGSMTLCPDQSKAVTAWVMDASDAGPNATG